jgi:ADP-heptose:LPS heptosyltransferase
VERSKDLSTFGMWRCDVQEFKFPVLGVMNQFFMGDSVLVESIARHLGIDECSYVLSNYPELFEAHPIVKGVRSPEELPENVRMIDLSKSIVSIRKQDGKRIVIPDKFLNMCKQAGFSSRLDAPQLYLKPTEYTTIGELRKFFPNRTNIGIALGSGHSGKTWLYMVRFIRKVLSLHYNVFIFCDRITWFQYKTLPKGCYLAIGNPIREMMTYIAMMDVMVGADTGPMHVAGALKVPIAVVCFKVFAELYEMYENAEILKTNNFTAESGIRGVSIKQVLKAVHNLVGTKPKDPPVAEEDTRYEKPKHHAIIRMRGLGDVLMSLPAIATLVNQNGNKSHSYTYITSYPAKAMLECSSLLTNVVGTDYKHSHAGFPLPPPDIDYSRFDTCINMINGIDFVPSSDTVERIDLFANLLGLNQCDRDLDTWKLKVPESWKSEAWNTLSKYGVSQTDRLIVLQVNSNGLSRNWQRTRQVEFCGIAKKHGWKIVLVSNETFTKYPKYCINLTGMLSIEQYMAMIAICTVGVGADSSLVHIGGCLDKPVIGLYGSVKPGLRIAHYKTVYPIVGEYSCVPCNDWQYSSCVGEKNSPHCMWNIRPKTVFNKVLEIHKKDPGGGS